MNLFDITKGIENACNVKPRAANDAEIFAYLEWQRQRHGLADLEERELCWLDHNTGRTRSTLHRICIGATFGRRTAAPRWEGEGSEREYRPAEYENGAYSIVMPGWNAHRQQVTMETLDDAGEIITSSTLPAEPKKGGVIWDKAAVHKAVGPVAKPAKASKRKPAPTVEIKAPASAPEAAQEREEALCPVATSAEPVEALSGPEIAPEADAGMSPEYNSPDRTGLDAQGEAMAAFIETLDTPTASVSTPTAAKRRPELGERIRITQPGYDGEAATVIAESTISRYAMRHSLIALTDSGRHLRLGLSGDNWVPLITGQEPQETADYPQNMPKRSPRHAFLIRRAWAERRERHLMRAALDAANAQYRKVDSERDMAFERMREFERHAHQWQQTAANRLAEIHRQRDKRRRSTLLARQRGYGLVMLHNVARARLDELQADLAKARQVPTYLDDTGMERHDAAAVAFDQGRHALDKAESLERTVEGAKAVAVRQQRAIETLADELEAMTARAIKAERALAAVTARRDGWPPAVRTVGVNFALAG